MKEVKVVLVIGNPKAQSRTSQIASEVARQLIVLMKNDGLYATSRTIELAELSPYIFDRENQKIKESIEQLSSSNLIIVASPTFKATYTGLLKSYFDLFPPEGLKGKLAISLMVGAALHHSLSVEVFLKPLLVELGASCPTKGLYVLDSQMEILPEVVSRWLEQERQKIMNNIKCCIVSEKA